MVLTLSLTLYLEMAQTLGVKRMTALRDMLRQSVTAIHASVLTGDPAKVVSVAKERSLTD